MVDATYILLAMFIVILPCVTSFRSIEFDTIRRDTGLVAINEVSPRSFNEGPDWVEIANIGDTIVDLSHWSMTDSSNNSPFIIPDNSTLAAGGFVVFTKLIDFQFGLSDDDCVVLFDNVDIEVHRLCWTPQEIVRGHSFGVCNSKNASLEYDASMIDCVHKFLAIPTPGSINDCESVYYNGNNIGYLTLKDDIRIDTNIELIVYVAHISGILLYYPGDRGDFFFIELVNGKVRVVFDLGSGIGSSSTSPVVKMGDMLTIQVSRTQNYGNLTVGEHNIPIEFPGSSRGLNGGIELWAGGVLDLTISESRQSFRGAIRSLVINLFNVDVSVLPVNPNVDFVGALGKRIRTTAYGFRKYSKLKFIVRPWKYQREGILLYVMGKGVDFLSVEIINGDVVFRFNPGQGAADIRTKNLGNTLFDGEWHVIVCERHHSNGVVRVDGVELANGTSPGSTIAVDVQGYIQIGKPDSYRKTAPFIGEVRHISINDKQLPIYTPLSQSFYGSSVATINGVNRLAVRKKFNSAFILSPVEKNGVLLLWGSPFSSGKGEYYALELINGALKFSFNAGSGAAHIYSSDIIWDILNDGHYHTISISRIGTTGEIWVDDAKVAYGSSLGSSIGIEIPSSRPLTVGGALYYTGLESTKGFTGRLMYFSIFGKPVAVESPDGTYEDRVSELNPKKCEGKECNNNCILARIHSDCKNNECIPPHCKKSEYYGMISISEVMIYDKKEGYDWVELHNIGHTDVNLSGWSLVDMDSVLFFIGNTTHPLPPGSYLVLSTLEGGSGKVTLSRNDGIMIRDSASKFVDQVMWEEATHGLSIAKCNNTWQSDIATRGMPNGCLANPIVPDIVTNKVIVNEIVAKSEDGSADWVELYNTGNTDINITGWFITDSLERNGYKFPADTIVRARNFFVIASGKSGGTGFPFGLGSGDSVILKTDTGILADSTSWVSGDAPKGRSWGRCGAIRGRFYSLSMITRGSINNCDGAIPGKAFDGVYPSYSDPRCGSDNYRNRSLELSMETCVAQSIEGPEPSALPQIMIGGIGDGPSRFQSVDHIKFCGKSDIYVWDPLGNRIKRWELEAQTAKVAEIITQDTLKRDLNESYTFPNANEFPEMNVFCGNQFDPTDRRVFFLVCSDSLDYSRLFVRDRPPGINASPVCGDEKFREIFLPNGPKDTFIRNVHDVVVDREGRFIFAERKRTLQCIKPDFSGPCEGFGNKGKAGYAVLNEVAASLKWIDTDKDGYIYVDDKDNGKILKLNRSGQIVLSMGGSGIGINDVKEEMEGVSVDGNGFIYGRDEGNERFIVFTSDGKFLKTFGESGYKNGQYTNADSFFIDKHTNYMFIADTGNYRWHMISLCGIETPEADLIYDYSNKEAPKVPLVVPKLVWGGTKGSENLPTTWNKINELTFGRNGYLWVGDSYNQRIQIFSMYFDSNLPSATDEALPIDETTDSPYQYRGHFVGLVGGPAPVDNDGNYNPKDYEFVPIRIAPSKKYRISSRWGIEAIKTSNIDDVMFVIDHSSQRILRFDYSEFSDEFMNANQSSYRDAQVFSALQPITDEAVRNETFADPNYASLWPMDGNVPMPLFIDIAGLSIDVNDNLYITNNEKNEVFRLSPTNPSSPRTTGYKLTLWFQHRENASEPESPELLNKAETVISYDGFLKSTGEPLGLNAVFVSAEKLALLQPYDANTGNWLRSHIGSPQSGSVLQDGRFRLDIEGAEVDPFNCWIVAMDEENGRVNMYDLSADMDIIDGELVGSLTDKSLNFGSVGSFGGRGNLLGQNASPDGVTFSRSRQNNGSADGKWICVADQKNFRVQCYMSSDIINKIPRTGIPRLNRIYKNCKWTYLQARDEYISQGGILESDEDYPSSGGEALQSASLALRKANVLVKKGYLIVANNDFSNADDEVVNAHTAWRLSGGQYEIDGVTPVEGTGLHKKYTALLGFMNKRYKASLDINIATYNLNEAERELAAHPLAQY